MNFNKIRPENETEDLLLSITKNCQTLIDQTKLKNSNFIDFLMKILVVFHVKKSGMKLKGTWTFRIIYHFGSLQDDIIGPIIFKEDREQVTKRMEDGQYMLSLSGYTRSKIEDFEKYLRTEVDLVEDDIRLVLDKYNSSFLTYEFQSGIYTFKDLSEAFFNILQLENLASSSEIVIEFDDINKKTKLVKKCGTIDIRFDEKSFITTVLGVTPGWAYKHYNEHISQKILDLISKNKIHVTCDINDSSVVNGVSQPILYSFLLDKKPGYKLLRARDHSL